MPAALYRSFEEKRDLMKASQSELSNHIRTTFAKERRTAVGKIIDA